MKVLYLNHNTPDYLAESLFHGLRSILGEDCVDVPRYDSMYSPLEEDVKLKLRGNGFSLYGLLNDHTSLNVKRKLWKKELLTYDLIVIADIWKMWNVFSELIKVVPFDKIVVLDGSDSSSIFPYSSIVQRIKSNPLSFFIPVHKVKYFKRELIGEGEIFNLKKVLPYGIRKNFGVPKNLKVINFSIPVQKINKVDVAFKKKMFNKHIVDIEVAGNIKDSFYSSIGSDKHYFTNESEYYKDLQLSKFGITTKRLGWDCMRHYELAANGAVICFKNLDEKFTLCAPHGLNNSNSLSYKNYAQLIGKINALSDEEYGSLLENSYKWIYNNTTEKVAHKFILDSFNS